MKMTTRLKATLKRLWQAYLEFNRHQHEFDEHGECRECGKILGDW